MDRDEGTEFGPELRKKKKKLKDLCFTGAHVDDLTSENVITQGPQQGEFVVHFLICLFVQCEIS